MDFKLIKIILILCFLIKITLIVFNNTFDFNSNYEYVKHVLSMDTTFRPDSFRHIHNPTIQLVAYLLIIGWEYLICIIGWVGFYQFCKRNELKLINISLLMAITLYFFGFISVASEWFLMYQSKLWDSTKCS